MASKFITKYQVITGDFQIVIKQGFDTWTDAYHWALNHDFGQYEEHGGLHATAYTARA